MVTIGGLYSFVTLLTPGMVAQIYIFYIYSLYHVTHKNKYGYCNYKYTFYCININSLSSNFLQIYILMYKCIPTSYKYLQTIRSEYSVLLGGGPRDGVNGCVGGAEAGDVGSAERRPAEAAKAR